MRGCKVRKSLASVQRYGHAIIRAICLGRRRCTHFGKAATVAHGTARTRHDGRRIRLPLASWPKKSLIRMVMAADGGADVISPNRARQ